MMNTYGVYLKIESVENALREKGYLCDGEHIVNVSLYDNMNIRFGVQENEQLAKERTRVRCDTNHQHAEFVYDRASKALEVPDAL